VALNTDPSAVQLEPFGIAGATGDIRSWLLKARWFGGRQHRVERIELDDLAVLRVADPTVLFTLWRVDYADAPPETYSLPLGIRVGSPPIGELGPDHLIGTTVLGARLAPGLRRPCRPRSHGRAVAHAGGGAGGRRPAPDG
jgi:hypothetical protein